MSYMVLLMMMMMTIIIYYYLTSSHNNFFSHYNLLYLLVYSSLQAVKHSDINSQWTQNMKPTTWLFMMICYSAL